ncbi:hypothetical protein [Pseudoduganella namucuonensis]|uniref:Uncharacterized protein n=1 Tax=Pseudoduganella namucuonensis TaxID=1035707 RepID=A0A1I7G9L8_9BURK|nr:hypothetical protein [Pseudoduganella namucuonensis]SFU45134.1 hypothetical protein SAMN05216552_1003167 [Pseudoduganella namucuonensis]
MFPFLWLWSPQFFLPWSGSVTQEIALERFFNAIPRSSGDGGIEYAAFKRASYGSQLGWITEVLLELTRNTPADDDSALGKLRLASADIELLKIEKQGQAGERIAAYLDTLRRQDGERFARLSERLLPLLAAPR